MASLVIFQPASGEALIPTDEIVVFWGGAVAFDSMDVYVTTVTGEELAVSWVQADGQTPAAVQAAIRDGYGHFGNWVAGPGVFLIRYAGWDKQDGTLGVRVEIVDDGTPETWAASYTVAPILSSVYEGAHVATGLDRLLDQFDGSVNLRLLASSYLDQVQGFEDIAYQLINAKSLAVVSGNQLDGLGQIVNVTRSGRSDEDYRLRIRAELAILTSQGSTEDLITVARLLLLMASPPPLEIVEYDPKTVYMRPTDTEIDEADALVAGPLLRRTVSAATEMLFVYSEYPDATTFTLSSQGATTESSASLGLADVSQTTGGHLSGSA
jgi:hypothetical protein